MRLEVAAGNANTSTGATSACCTAGDGEGGGGGSVVVTAPFLSNPLLLSSSVLRLTLRRTPARGWGARCASHAACGRTAAEKAAAPAREQRRRRSG
eukprot:scaffold108432_cov33-Tisochrysis_lutea.AAC.3